MTLDRSDSLESAVPNLGPEPRVKVTVRLYAGSHELLVEEFARLGRRRRAARAAQLMLLGLLFERATLRPECAQCVLDPGLGSGEPAGCPGVGGWNVHTRHAAHPRRERESHQRRGRPRHPRLTTVRRGTRVASSDVAGGCRADTPRPHKTGGSEEGLKAAGGADDVCRSAGASQPATGPIVPQRGGLSRTSLYGPPRDVRLSSGRRPCQILNVGARNVTSPWNVPVPCRVPAVSTPAGQNGTYTRWGCARDSPDVPAPLPRRGLP